MTVDVWNYYIESGKIVDQLTSNNLAFVRRLVPDGSYVMCGNGTGPQKRLVL